MYPCIAEQETRRNNTILFRRVWFLLSQLHRDQLHRVGGVEIVVQNGDGGGGQGGGGGGIGKDISRKWNETKESMRDRSF